MTTISTELGVIIFISAFFGVYTFLSALPGYPPGMKFISTTSTVIFTAGIPAIAGTCAVVTGIPCAAALGIYAVANLVTTYFTSNTLVSYIIITPLMIGVIYIVSKLARGGG
jgi:hypothetical protein